MSDLNVIAIINSRDVIASLNLSPTPPLELGGTPPLYSSEGLDVLAGKAALEKEDVMALLARITDNSRWTSTSSFSFWNLSGSSSSRQCLVATWCVVLEDSMAS